VHSPIRVVGFDLGRVPSVAAAVLAFDARADWKGRHGRGNGGWLPRRSRSVARRGRRGRSGSGLNGSLAFIRRGGVCFLVVIVALEEVSPYCHALAWPCLTTHERHWKPCIASVLLLLKNLLMLMLN
jgi:hypothetical protein